MSSDRWYYEALKEVKAERDAARAENTRLREALEPILAATAQRRSWGIARAALDSPKAPDEQ